MRMLLSMTIFKGKVCLKICKKNRKTPSYFTTENIIITFIFYIYHTIIAKDIICFF
jgi:hypothetical protein